MTSLMSGYISACVAVRREHFSRRHVAYVEKHLEFFVEGSNDLMQAYDYDDDYYYLPRGVLLDPEFPELPRLSDQRIDLVIDLPDSNIVLRPHQKMPVKKLRRAGGGILHAPTGSGKTVMFVYLIAKEKQRTLVIVHTMDLLRQWQKEIRNSMGYEPGVIGDGQWTEKDITIATVQSLARFDFNKTDFTQRWGLVVLDEAHRAPASSFAKVMQAMAAKQLYGATATPTRQDGMHPLMHAIIGPTVARVKETGLITKGKLILPTVKFVKTGFKSKHATAMAVTQNRYAKQKLYQKLVKALVEDTDRNNMIVDLIIKHKDESVLVLSDRIAHLQTIHDMVMARDWQVNCHVVTGSMKNDLREQIIQQMRDGHANVMLSTSLADEGLDIPILNVLILAFPSKAIQRLTQRLGRIMRTNDDKSSAIVYDIADVNVPTFKRHATARYEFYKGSKAMKVKGWKTPKER